MGSILQSTGGSGGGLVAKSCPTLATPGTVVCQAFLSMGSPRQEYWSGLPFHPPVDLPDPGIKPASPAWQAVSWIAGWFFTDWAMGTLIEQKGGERANGLPPSAWAESSIFCPCAQAFTLRHGLISAAPWLPGLQTQTKLHHWLSGSLVIEGRWWDFLASVTNWVNSNNRSPLLYIYIHTYTHTYTSCSFYFSAEPWLMQGSSLEYAFGGCSAGEKKFLFPCRKRW